MNSTSRVNGRQALPTDSKFGHLILVAAADLCGAWKGCGLGVSFFSEPPSPNEVEGREVLVVAENGFEARRQADCIAEDCRANGARSTHVVERRPAEQLLKILENGEAISLEGLEGAELIRGSNGDAHSLSDQTEASSSWPKLQLKESPTALSFPVEVFPQPLQTYCREVAEATLAPLDFVGVSMLVTAGAANGQSVNIEVKSGWNEAPSLNGVLVAPPGSVKTPVIRQVVKPLNAIDRNLRNKSALARKKWEAAKKTRGNAKKANPKVDYCAALDEEPTEPELPAEVNSIPEMGAGEEPPQHRAIVRDITRESLAVILQDNPRGLLCDPDEAAGWIASFNEYKGKGGADRQFWLSIWSGTAVSVDRRGGREAFYVPYPFVAVLGGLPPDMLGVLSDERGRDDGLLDRILFAFPEEFPEQSWTDREVSVQSEQAWAGAINRLFKFAMRIVEVLEDERTRNRERPHLVRMSPEAKAVWITWWNSHVRETEDHELNVEAGAWSKMRSHAARFALILSRLRWSCDPPPIVTHLKKREPVPETIRDHEYCPPGSVLPEDVEGAIKLAEYFKSHVLRVAHRMRGSLGDANAEWIVAWIRRNRLATFRVADVGANCRRFRNDSEALDSALKHLAGVGAVRIRPVPVEPPRRGRKASPSYDVNPELLIAPENSRNTANSLEIP